MNIREANEHDLPAIVELLKISLGESLMPKSAQYWQWKHIDNPFGRSPVLLAFDNDLLIGIRAFMPWQWRSGDTVYNSVRAVDTATHPDYQGKGIFKKLTLQLLEHCKGKPYEFVFNTPNEKSKPGYLKMGWKEAGKVPVRFDGIRPFRMLGNFVAPSKEKMPTPDNSSVKNFISHAGVEELLLKERLRHSGKNITNHSVRSLAWRYLDVPVMAYGADGVMEGHTLHALFFYRLKASRFGTELRITDLFLNTQDHLPAVRKLIRKKARQYNAAYVTISGAATPAGTSRLSVLPALKGPAVTIRSINGFPLTGLEHFNRWDPSLGDLELF
jgi:N-acetylglutamate synthase-like GNAT family acetyltransferase